MKTGEERAIPAAVICARRHGGGCCRGQRHGSGRQGRGGGGCCDHLGGGERRDGTAVPQPPTFDLRPPMMSALSFSPVVPLLRPFKPGVGGGIDEMTPKEGESDRGVRLFPFSEAGGSLLSTSHSPPPFYLITPILTV